MTSTGRSTTTSSTVDPSRRSTRPPRLRRPTSAGIVVMVVAGSTIAVVAAVLAAGLVVRVATGAGWRSDYAALADRVTDREATARTAHGNILCLDVCRSLTSTYRSDAPAESTVQDLAERMRRDGFADVGSDCEENVWCSAWGTYDGLGVQVSQYKPDSWAAQHPDLLHQVTVVVSQPE